MGCGAARALPTPREDTSGYHGQKAARKKGKKRRKQRRKVKVEEEEREASMTNVPCSPAATVPVTPNLKGTYSNSNTKGSDNITRSIEQLQSFCSVVPSVCVTTDSENVSRKKSVEMECSELKSHCSVSFLNALRYSVNDRTMTEDEESRRDTWFSGWGLQKDGAGA
eukprot:TRINITY_DN18883_c2_g1_i1.p2 TRINITY_DN18883_c2_g1~~TRINITY_DN18883_c2_g1_i1.p2  ORF type:complete len:167 (+),score=39.16 TRINITY_DN18883_c2_g1_i1:125-625(+)